MYDKVSTNMNFVEREKKIEKFWAEIPGIYIFAEELEGSE